MDQKSHFKALREAKRRAKATGIRQPIATMTRRTMHAAEMVGSDAVRFSAALSGDAKLKTVMPFQVFNPLSDHAEDSPIRKVWKRDTDARNPIDPQALETARLQMLTDTLRALRLIR